MGTTGPRWPVAVVAAAHAALSVVLAPDWLFTKYPDAARALEQGFAASQRAGDFSPAYLALHALLSPQAVHWAQVMLGAAAVLAVGLACQRALGLAAGLAGALALGLTSSWVTYEAMLEPDLAIGALHALVLWWLALEPTRRSRAAALLSLLASACLRPVGLVVAAAVPWAAGWSRKAVVGALVVVALGFVAVSQLLAHAAVGAWAAPMSPGAVLHMGHRPEFTPFGGQSPFALKMLERQHGRYEMHELYRTFAAASASADGAVSQEAYWGVEVLRLAQAYPGRWLAHLFWKAVLFALGPPGHDTTEARLLDARLNGLWLPGDRWLFTLGTVGLLAALFDARRRRAVAGAAALAVAICAVTVVFYGTSRYRIAAAPGLAFGVAALVHLALAARRAPRQLAGPLAVAAAVGALAFGAGPVQAAATWSRRGLESSQRAPQLQRELAAGHFADAAKTLGEMLASQPMVLRQVNTRGLDFEAPELARTAGAVSAERFGDAGALERLVLVALGARAGAREAMAGEARALTASGVSFATYDQLLEPSLEVARCFLAAGDAARAAPLIAAASEAQPGTLPALAARVASGEAAGTAPSPFRAELERLHDRLSASLALAEWEVLVGDHARALGSTRVLRDAVPDFALARYWEARALALAGRDDEARASLAAAFGAFPGHPFPVQPLERLSGSGPPFLRAEILVRRGQLSGAREVIAALEDGAAGKAEWLAALGANQLPPPPSEALLRSP
ncbi:MAG: hypothetical protein K1X89_10875 [Myxococcaceae bacterium]|nr:hypothetical protein [Myxococcaceae bacterium]